MIKRFKEERKIYERQQRSAEREMLPIFRKALKQSIQPVYDYINTYGLNEGAINLINRNVWLDAYLKCYENTGVKVAKKEYTRQNNTEEKNDALQFLVDFWTTTMRNFAYAYTYHIQAELNHTTIKILTRALGDTNALGLDEQGSIRLFKRTVNGLMRPRSLTISRTEATTITNLGKEVGAMSYMNETGQRAFKVWLGRNDSRERPAHLEENNTILPIDSYYNLDGENCHRPGDLTLSAGQRINCRCTQSIISERLYKFYIERGMIVDGKLVGAS